MEPRGMLAGIREHVCHEEQRVITEMSLAGRQESAHYRARADGKQQAAALRSQHAQTKERKDRHAALWEVAFDTGTWVREVTHSRSCFQGRLAGA